jgi:SOS-response transcriptional repressor LexA
MKDYVAKVGARRPLRSIRSSSSFADAPATLPKKEFSIVRFIEHTIRAEGVPPTAAEVAMAFRLGLGETHEYLRSLERKDIVARAGALRPITVLVPSNELHDRLRQTTTIPEEVIAPIAGDAEAYRWQIAAHERTRLQLAHGRRTS